MFAYFIHNEDLDRLAIRKDRIDFICESQGTVRISLINTAESIPVQGSWEEVLGKLGLYSPFTVNDTAIRG